MKRSAKIYIIVLIWGAALIQLFFNSRVKIEEEVIQTFVASDISEYEMDIMIWGEYGNASYDETTVRNILVNTATEFGISDGYVLSDQNGELEDITFLRISNRKDALSFQFITEHGSGKNFLVAKMTLQGMKPVEAEPMRMLENFYEDIGIDYRKNISVQGNFTRRMSEREMKTLANHIFDQISAKYIDASYSSELKNDISGDMPFTYIIFGYTKILPVATNIEGKKVNIRVIFDYEPAEQVTNICVKFVY